MNIVNINILEALRLFWLLILSQNVTENTFQQKKRKKKEILENKSVKKIKFQIITPACNYFSNF